MCEICRIEKISAENQMRITLHSRRYNLKWKFIDRYPFLKKDGNDNDLKYRSDVMRVQR